jgi:hypothetical protein
MTNGSLPQGTVQREVLEHITREGHALLADFELQQQPATPSQGQGQGGAGGEGGGGAAPCPPPGVVLKVLSDIDDTLFSSGGAFPAGTDTRYPRWGWGG